MRPPSRNRLREVIAVTLTIQVVALFILIFFAGLQPTPDQIVIYFVVTAPPLVAGYYFMEI